jgi:hypothetical protein
MNKEEILKIAKEKYPVGTKVLMTNNRNKATIENLDDIDFWHDKSIHLKTSNSLLYDCSENKWAKIISAPNKIYELW